MLNAVLDFQLARGAVEITMKTENEKPFMSISAFARLLGVSWETADQMAKTGAANSVLFPNGRRRISREWYQNWAQMGAQVRDQAEQSESNEKVA